MDWIFSLERVAPRAITQELEECNRATEPYGLTLSPHQMRALEEERAKALRNTGRVEFGEGILKKLILAFCDSPYIMQDSYESVIAELQEIFYYFKNESLERLTDDELLEAMRSFFNGPAHGSTEVLAGSSLEELCRKSGGIEQEDEDDEW